MALANPDMFPAFRSGDTSTLPSTGSDHTPILIYLHPPSPDMDKPRPRWQEAHWPALTDNRKEWRVPPPRETPSSNPLD